MKSAIVAVSANVQYLPLAPAYLKSSLISEKIDPPTLFNFNFESSIDAIAEKLLNCEFDIIGFSVYVWNISIVKHLAKRIKEIKPFTKIVFGGPEVSPRAKSVMEEIPECDFIVCGEGELTFKELMLSLINKKPLREIKGLLYRENGKIFENEKREVLDSLDLIENPYKDLDFKGDGKFQVIPLETMRGCRYKCRFCFYSKGKNKIREFSEDKVFEFLDFALKKSSIEKIYLMDPDFTSNKNRAKKICSFISENNSNLKPFHTEIRAEEVDEEMASFLKKANILDVEVGLQSTNEEALKISGRPTNLDLVRRGIENLNKVGIKSELQLILGLPLETKESFLKSIDDAVEMNPTTLAIFRLLVLPGTYFYDNGDSFNLQFEKHPPWRILKTKEIDEEEMVTLARCGMYASYLYSNFKLTTKYILKELKMKYSDISYHFSKEESAYKVDEPITSQKHREIIAEHIPFLIEKLCQERGLNFTFYKAIMTKEMAFKGLE